MNFKQLLIDNFTYKTSYIARQAQGMNVKETEDYIAVDCGLPADTFNIITLLNNNVTEGIEKLYKEVNNYNQKKFPMSVWFWDDRYEQTIKSELIKLDLKRSRTKYCNGRRIKYNSSDNKHARRFYNTKASSPEQIKKFGETLANLFGSSEEGIHVQAFYNQTASFDLWNSGNMNLYLGLYKDEVISVGSLVCTKDSIGIYDIATKEEMRGKGFGSTMFHYLLQEAKELNVVQCVLQASPDGINIYKRPVFNLLDK